MRRALCSTRSRMSTPPVVSFRIETSSCRWTSTRVRRDPKKLGPTRQTLAAMDDGALAPKQRTDSWGGAASCSCLALSSQQVSVPVHRPQLPALHPGCSRLQGQPAVISDHAAGSFQLKGLELHQFCSVRPKPASKQCARSLAHYHFPKLVLRGLITCRRLQSNTADRPKPGQERPAGHGHRRQLRRPRSRAAGGIPIRIRHLPAGAILGRYNAARLSKKTACEGYVECVLCIHSQQIAS